MIFWREINYNNAQKIQKKIKKLGKIYIWKKNLRQNKYYQINSENK